MRALKGLVRLQAIVRGRAVRRQAIATLRSLQSIVNIQSEVCAKRCDNQVKSTVHCQEKTLMDLGEKDIKVRSCAMLQSNLHDICIMFCCLFLYRQSINLLG